ncbi:enoyl-CoA hydratase-related protein [Streptomyces sp. RS2]|uniref:enoyl-CoA hydratase-related protein n=1 Tax=Streptomyces sp. RS2 TaxID=1451205 RepID=UPI0021F91EE6|nr:enoyl-CoA hydratase-related protein [Streptomyces sp. RS2]MCW1100207.1 enoyl-CoA hydratase-related protein [Streptomyces sp. RS2]
MEEHLNESVLCEQRDSVLLVTFNRPGALNSLTVEMEAEYRRILTAAAADEAVRAVVVTGAGRAFCAGADVSALDALVSDPDRRHFGTTFHTPLLLDKPLIAAVNGGCAGLGLVQALFCDVRFVAEEAKLVTSFAQRGVVAEHGLTFLLTHAVGEGHARDLLLSSRVIRGTEAARIGLATRAVPRQDVVQSALDYAEELVRTCSPASLAAIKQQFRDGFLTEYQREAARDEALLAEAFRGADFAEGVASYRERRSPQFRGVSQVLVPPAPFDQKAVR